MFPKSLLILQKRGILLFEVNLALQTVQLREYLHLTTRALKKLKKYFRCDPDDVAWQLSLIVYF